MTGSLWKIDFRRAAQAAALTTVVQLTLIAFFFRSVVLGHGTLIRDGDSADQTFGWLTKVFAAIQRGELALWDFGTLSGVSFIGELQTGPLYPPALLFGLFARIGDPTYIDYFLLLHLLIGSLGMHVLARAYRLPWLAGLGGAIIYAYGSVFTARAGGQGNLFVGLAWIPWAAAAAQWAMTVLCLRGALFPASLAGVAMALALLGGHNHSTAYAAMAVGGIAAAPVVIVLLSRQASGLTHIVARACAVVIMACIVTVVLSLPQLIATDEYLRLSYKWYGPAYTNYPHVVPYGEYLKWSLEARDILTIFTGGPAAQEGGTMFVTLVGAACAVVALIAGFRRRSAGLGVLIAAGGLLLALSLAMGYASVPPFGSIFYHLPVINSLRTPARATCLFAFAAALLAMGGLTIIFSTFRQFMNDLGPRLAWTVPRAILLVLVILLVLEARNVTRRFVVPLSAPGTEIGAILEGEMTRTLLGLSRAQPLMYRYHGARIFVPPNIANVFPVLSADGFRSTRPIAYYDYFDFSPTSARTNALGIRWWVSDKDVPELRLLKTIGNFRIYERPNAMPIFSLLQAGGGRAAPPIESVDWSVNEVTVHFSRPIGGRLTFAQTPYPGWSAAADGIPVSVKEFEGLQSVVMPDETRAVTFRYAPVWFIPSLAFSLLALACIVCMGAFPLPREQLMSR